jgi:hypothetical protein
MRVRSTYVWVLELAVEGLGSSLWTFAHTALGGLSTGMEWARPAERVPAKGAHPPTILTRSEALTYGENAGRLAIPFGRVKSRLFGHLAKLRQNQEGS